ncbi:DUF5007 domain-containing protein [Sphingobacterium sp. GVS05A]|uniref:DUF5007 domain-containing protein n=1 Tax=Sphingobacterium sp. GVS05A TaxID=2862679 RepID=UPI001CBD8059|nr:DUF5007 domain-containing protein [Sphingobacterium sp. GVS05A]
MEKKIFKSAKQLLVLGMGFFMLASCNKYIPDDQDSLGTDVVYSTNEFMPLLGRNTFYNNIVNIGQNTSQPLNFKIVNLRDIDGQPSTLFEDKFPVKIWTMAYSGEEKSIAEIENKRKVEYRPILEILEKSGNINFWGQAVNSNFVKAQPDSGYVFDIEVSNTGGRRYLRNFKLKPYRERAFEPSIMDPVTGLAPLPYTHPNRTTNLYGVRTNQFIYPGLINVYFNKLESKGTGSRTLTISFLDSLNRPIDVKKFAATEWDKLVHGFNHRFENGKVIYDVAYPIPLAPIKTDYSSSDGTYAVMNFKFRRKGQFGFLEDCGIEMPFAIYEEGDWEIQFRFTRETPKFD